MTRRMIALASIFALALLALGAVYSRNFTTPTQFTSVTDFQSTSTVTFASVPTLPTGGLIAGTTTLTEAELGVLDSLAATKAEIQNELVIKEFGGVTLT